MTHMVVSTKLTTATNVYTSNAVLVAPVRAPDPAVSV